MLLRHRRRSVILRLAAIAAVTLLAAPAGAQSLSGSMTVDNAFTVFLGTSATVQGTSIATGNSWPTTFSFGPVALTPGQNYWLQVEAIDQGGPGAFIGDFSLTGPFLFGNGLTTLSTNTTNWTARTGSFAGAALGIVDLGANGVGPWGTRPGIAASTHWIWESGQCGGCTVYFSTPIVAQQVAPPGTTVPEPSTWALLATGVVALGAVRRRRRT
jgi:hypothetical protein